jgi:hypothetical protein
MLAGALGDKLHLVCFAFAGREDRAVAQRVSRCFDLLVSDSCFL